MYGTDGHGSLHQIWPSPSDHSTAAGRSALKTNDFEAQFTISAKPGISGFRGDGFAFWYSEESTGEVQDPEMEVREYHISYFKPFLMGRCGEIP